MKLEQIIEVIWILSAAFLVVFVLLHSPKNEGIGLSGQSQMFTSAKSAEKTLNRITWALGLIFLASSVVLSADWLGPSSGSSAPSLPASSQQQPAPSAPDLPGPSAAPIPSDLGPEQ